MLVHQIQTAVKAYKNWLGALSHHPFLYEWETLRHFQDHWNLDTPDPAAMFNQAFYNSETRRMWQADHWEPKAMMLEFWRNFPLTVRLMFDDLLNETKAVEGRIGRFLFGCDALLADYKKAKPTSILNNHYHGDYRMIALYLALSYPDAYAPYDLDHFRGAMNRFGAKDVPQQHDLPRYFKALNTWRNFLEKDPEIKHLMDQYLHPKRHYTLPTLWQAADFCRFAATHP